MQMSAVAKLHLALPPWSRHGLLSRRTELAPLFTGRAVLRLLPFKFFFKGYSVRRVSLTQISFELLMIHFPTVNDSTPGFTTVCALTYKQTSGGVGGRVGVVWM